MNAARLLLAGASWRERLLACLGALAGIGFTALATASLPLHLLPFLVAPMGASAVLVFAVPASPLAQPWPVIGGNALSALVGVASAALLGHGAMAAGVAVGGAILVMSLLRCLHPPGGACALLAVLGGGEIARHGFALALAPVGLNALLLVGAGLAFHRLSGHSYPHRPLPAPARPTLLAVDVEAALAEAGESFDVAAEDLIALLERAERHARTRRGA